MYRYTMWLWSRLAGRGGGAGGAAQGHLPGRGSHSSTFQLNVGDFRGIGGAFLVILGVIRVCQWALWCVWGFVFVLETAQVELRSGRV
jgi:hypothetical protein